MGIISLGFMHVHESGQFDPRYTILVRIAADLCVPTSALIAADPAPDYGDAEQRAHQLIALLKESNLDALETTITFLEGMVAILNTTMRYMHLAEDDLRVAIRCLEDPKKQPPRGDEAIAPAENTKFSAAYLVEAPGIELSKRRNPKPLMAHAFRLGCLGL
jgi:hypothetical protein